MLLSSSCHLIESELAEKMGATRPNIACLEASGMSPSLDTLHRAADAPRLELVVDLRHCFRRFW